jgi:hypothetical protein
MISSVLFFSDVHFLLQNSMDLLLDGLGSSNKTRVTSIVDGSAVGSIEAERVSNITQEEGQEPTTIATIKTEPNECCVPVVSVTQISYRLCPELPATISLCPCETKFCLLDNGF